MGVVDLSDQLRKYYCVRLKSRKYYRYIFGFYMRQRYLIHICLQDTYHQLIANTNIMLTTVLIQQRGSLEITIAESAKAVLQYHQYQLQIFLNTSLLNSLKESNAQIVIVIAMQSLLELIFGSLLIHYTTEQLYFTTYLYTKSYRIFQKLRNMCFTGRLGLGPDVLAVSLVNTLINTDNNIINIIHRN